MQDGSDNAEYVLGLPDVKKLEDNRKKDKEQEYLGRLQDMRTAFRASIAQLPQQLQTQPGVRAVLAFLDGLDVAALERFPALADIRASNPLVSFRLQGEVELICQQPAIAAAAANTSEDDDGPRAMCLITGQQAPIERLHTAIKGVWGAQTSGANIVSFNARAFESYGKTERQGENAPISKAAAFKYTTALNHLLRKGSPQRMQVGDASTVCWADHASPFETAFSELFGQDAPENPDDGTPAVQALFNAMHSGRFAQPEGDNRFHVLGLSPNAARISVRFYHCLPLRDMAGRITQHFADLELVHGPHDAPYPSLFRLLTAVALQAKADNIPPNLGGGIVAAILSGPNAPYPALWLNAAVGRCRAEQKVSYLRAAAIKACLNRSIRFRHSPEKEFLPMLNPDNHHTAYRLGRLFAVLEKIQEEASPGLNATIRDRYYGAASSTPVAVFTTLLRLKNAHLKKLVAGRAVWFEKLLGEVLAPVQDFPRQLPLPDQGRFALGYYHQRQDFFTRKSQDAAPNELQGELV
ncbi:MAG: type I-C CRISPR-associated protein Cas8c/Csd1 [Proteobacteria bacterium]|nr:type I-C CRISPR-associated protein Cas8c/Csd1 [Pseudomonadota bacterium]